MRKLRFFVCVLAVIGVSTACNPVVYTDTAPNVDFTKYDSYAFLPSGNTSDFSLAFEEKLAREVNQEMNARGYELDNRNPDLLVLVSTMFEEEERLATTPVYTTYDYYYPGFDAVDPLGPYYYTDFATIPRVTGYGIREIEYTEGTFVVDVIDKSNSQIVWRGWSETPINRGNLDDSIRDYIDNIFGEYPVDAK